MATAKKHIHSIAAYQNHDPTRTTTLRNQFAREMGKRFRELRGIIRKAIVDEDVFGLKGLSRDERKNPATLAKNDYSDRLSAYQVSTPGHQAFNFRSNQRKVEEFMDWLREAHSAEILEMQVRPRIGPGIRIPSGERAPWTNVYIKSSYQEGIRRSREELAKAGYDVPDIDAANQDAVIRAAFNQPIHADRAGILFARTFNDLKGITDQMDAQISRVLSQGLIDGKNPNRIARELNAVIKGGGADLGLTDTLGRFIPSERRARILARTEMIRAHHMGNIQEMRNFGVAGVKIKAEWRTAGDGRVCPDCISMASGGPYTLDQIEPWIPLHPQCRCIALPIDLEEANRTAIPF